MILTSDVALVGGARVERFALRVEGGAIVAAQKLGLRVVLARSFYDWDGAPKNYREAPADATARFHELHHEFRSTPRVSVHAAPHSLHGASAAMIRAGAEAAREASVPWHLHLAEEKYQVDDA